MYKWKKELRAQTFYDHRIFVDYYDDTEAAESVAQVEQWAKQLMDEFFEDEEVQEDYPEGILAQKVIEAPLEELPEYLASEDSLIRDLACKRYMQLKYGYEYTTWYIDIWNYIMDHNGETHGAFMAMCFKLPSWKRRKENEGEELRALGTRVWEDLKRIQGGVIDFDT